MKIEIVGNKSVQLNLDWNCAYTAILENIIETAVKEHSTWICINPYSVLLGDENGKVRLNWGDMRNSIHEGGGRLIGIDNEDWTPAISKAMTSILFGETSEGEGRIIRQEPLLNKKSPIWSSRFRVVAHARTYLATVNGAVGKDGYFCVIKLQSQEALMMPVSALGFDDYEVELLREDVRARNGLILITGGTGSGKTHTACSIINEINRDKYATISIEHPVEMKIRNVNQLEVNPGSGGSFSQFVNAAMRMDPDYIFVGDVRDAETAKAVVSAALTGHVVIACMHSLSPNGGSNTLASLLKDREYSGFATLSGVAYQLLLPCLCPTCSFKDDSVTKKLHANSSGGKGGGFSTEGAGGFLSKEINYTKDSAIFRASPSGCKECKYRGYKGVVPIFSYVRFNKTRVERDYEEQEANISLTRKMLKNLIAKKIDIATVSIYRQITDHRCAQVLKNLYTNE